MALFGKKVSADQWRAQVVPMLAAISDVCSMLEETGNAVARDVLHGWALVASDLAELRSYEEAVKGFQSVYSKIGQPDATDKLVTAGKQNIDEFLSLSKMASTGANITMPTLLEDQATVL